MRECTACAGANRPEAKFCRHCGGPLPLGNELGLESRSEEAKSVLPGEALIPGLRTDSLFQELCWLVGAPILVSVVYTIYARIDRATGLTELVALGTMAGVASVGCARNLELVKSGLKWPTARDWAHTALLALAAGPVLTGAFWLLEQLGFTLVHNYAAPYEVSGWSPLMPYLDMALLTPIIEEVLFRGLIQPKLGRVMKPTEALIVQAALFSAIHLSPVILVTHFAMGLVFGWLRQRTASIFPGIVLHGLWNAWVLASGG